MKHTPGSLLRVLDSLGIPEHYARLELSDPYADVTGLVFVFRVHHAAQCLPDGSTADRYTPVLSDA